RPGGAGGGVLLGGVVLLDEVPGVPGRGVQPRGPGRELEEVPHADREVRRVDERPAARDEGLGHARELLAPSGGSADDPGAPLRQREEVGDGRARVRELEDDVGGAEALGGQPGGLRVLLRGEAPGDVVPARRGGRLDLPAHLSRSDDSEAHNGSQEKNSRWSARTAPAASFSSTTKETLRREAPCEIIRMLIPSTARKIREAIPGLNFRSRPTRQTMARPPATSTVASSSRSLRIW